MKSGGLGFIVSHIRIEMWATRRGNFGSWSWRERKAAG